MSDGGALYCPLLMNSFCCAHNKDVGCPVGLTDGDDEGIIDTLGLTVGDADGVVVG